MVLEASVLQPALRREPRISGTQWSRGEFARKSLPGTGFVAQEPAPDQQRCPEAGSSAFAKFVLKTLNYSLAPSLKPVGGDTHPLRHGVALGAGGSAPSTRPRCHGSCFRPGTPRGCRIAPSPRCRPCGAPGASRRVPSLLLPAPSCGHGRGVPPPPGSEGSAGSVPVPGILQQAKGARGGSPAHLISAGL